MNEISRRALLQLAATAVFSPALAVRKMPHVAVIGAGAFGGWTALELRRRGVPVTLIDAWGPGNARASSGGETRVIRATYGTNEVYTDMAIRAMQLWRLNERRWNRKLYKQTGALWMVVNSEEFETASIPLLESKKLPYEKLTVDEASTRFPQIDFEEVKWVLLEQRAGFLLARNACQIVVEQFLARGGTYQKAEALPVNIKGGTLNRLQLADDSTIQADRYLFACGPWLGKIFPDVLGSVIQPTRQEVFFFGTPPGDTRFDEDHIPVWINHAASLFYGIPGNQYRGFKIADDTRGTPFDPTDGERRISDEGLNAARRVLSMRFPALKDAPLLESRVCQYENSPDGNFILDRHPEADNVWIAGGGSGHGYKMGPAIGEYVADMILKGKTPDPMFSIARLSE